MRAGLPRPKRIVLSKLDYRNHLGDWSKPSLSSRYEAARGGRRHRPYNWAGSAVALFFLTSRLHRRTMTAIWSWILGLVRNLIAQFVRAGESGHSRHLRGLEGSGPGCSALIAMRSSS